MGKHGGKRENAGFKKIFKGNMTEVKVKVPTELIGFLESYNLIYPSNVKRIDNSLSAKVRELFIIGFMEEKEFRRNNNDIESIKELIYSSIIQKEKKEETKNLNILSEEEGEYIKSNIDQIIKYCKEVKDYLKKHFEKELFGRKEIILWINKNIKMIEKLEDEIQGSHYFEGLKRKIMEIEKKEFVFNPGLRKYLIRQRRINEFVYYKCNKIENVTVEKLNQIDEFIEKLYEIFDYNSFVKRYEISYNDSELIRPVQKNILKEREL